MKKKKDEDILKCDCQGRLELMAEVLTRRIYMCETCAAEYFTTNDDRVIVRRTTGRDYNAH